MYFLFALEQNQKALKYFHTNSIELKPLFPAQKGQVPIFLPSERLILPKENQIKINICNIWMPVKMLLLKPYQSALIADPSHKWGTWEGIGNLFQKQQNKPEAMPGSHSKSQIQFLSLSRYDSLLLIFTPTCLHRAHVFTNIIQDGLRSCYNETRRYPVFK